MIGGGVLVTRARGIRRIVVAIVARHSLRARRCKVGEPLGRMRYIAAVFVREVRSDWRRRARVFARSWRGRVIEAFLPPPAPNTLTGKDFGSSVGDVPEPGQVGDVGRAKLAASLNSSVRCRPMSG